MPFRFRFRPIALMACIVLAALGILLGQWQQGRAQEKEFIQARLHARSALPPLTHLSGVNPQAQQYRRVQLTGQFDAAWPVLLANRPLGGQSGFYLAMPFTIAGSQTRVLVLRGWLPRQADYAAPAYVTPAASVTLEGVVVPGVGRVLELGEGEPLAPGAMVQNLTPEELARASGLPLLPLVVQQSAAATPQDQMRRDWPSAGTGSDKHRGYAFQWYALAALAIVFYVITGFRFGTRTND